MLTRVIVSSSHAPHQRTPSSLRADPDTRYHTTVHQVGGGAGPGDGIKESPVAVLSSVGPHSPVSCAVIPVTMRILLIHAVSLFVCSFVSTVFEQMFFYWGFSYMFTCVFFQFKFAHSLIFFVIRFKTKIF